LYGVREFLGDLDAAREFWRDGDHLVGAVLDWISGPGFAEFFERYGREERTAHEFRQRYILAALKAIKLV
jgi:phenylalanine-4-hydroxylase